METPQDLKDAFDALAEAMYDGSKNQIREARNQIWTAMDALDENGLISDVEEAKLFLIDAIHDAIFTGIAWGRGDEGLSTERGAWRDGNID